MGSGASTYQSQSDNLGLLYVNQTRKISQYTQTESSIFTTHRETKADTANPSETKRGFERSQNGPEHSALSMTGISLQTGNDAILCEDDDDLDTISISSQDSVSSMFKEPTPDGLERIQYHVKRLLKRKNILCQGGMVELTFFIKVVPKPKPNFKTGKFEKRSRRFIDEMIRCGIGDVILRVIRDYSAQAFEGEMGPKNLALAALPMTLLMTMSSACISNRFCRMLYDREIYKDLFALLSNPRLAPEQNNNFKMQGNPGSKPWADIVGFIMTTLVVCNEELDLRQAYRDCDAVRLFAQLRSTLHVAVRPLAELGFAGVVMETDTDHVILEDKHLQFWKKITDEMVKGKKEFADNIMMRTHSAESFLKALNRFAMNDTNKVNIAKHAVFGFYETHLDEKTCSEKELETATKGVYLLAFKAQDIIKSNDTCMQRLTHLADNSKNTLVRHQARGALLVIERWRDREPVSKATPQQTSDNKCHIVISCETGSLEQIHHINDEIVKLGYSVEMSYENKEPERICDSIDKASVVIACVNQEYIESPQCRHEFEYAIHMEKKIIPLLTESNISTAGWLDSISSEHSIEYTSIDKLDRNIDKLMADING